MDTDEIGEETEPILEEGDTTGQVHRLAANDNEVVDPEAPFRVRRLALNENESVDTDE